MELVCHQCGLKYKSLGRNRKQKYCSRECYAIATIVDIPTSLCPVCGKEFQWNRAHKPQKFCSRECSYNSQRKLKEIVCQSCGEMFTVNWENSKRKYCSLECVHKANDTQIYIECKQCGQSFRARELDVKNGKKYCSNKCRYLGTTSGFGLSWKAGYRNDLGDVYFRSSWEANYARLLNHMKDMCVVRDWEFEPEAFEFEDGTVYIPDFLVTSMKGRKTYHEVKGWLDERSIRKLKLMKEHKPNVDVVLVDTSLYRTLESIYAQNISGWEVS